MTTYTNSTNGTIRIYGQDVLPGATITIPLGYYPITKNSTDNTTPVEIELNDPTVSSWQIDIEVLTGTITTGYFTVTTKSFDGISYKDKTETITGTELKTVTLAGKYKYIKLAPTDIDSGVTYSVIINAIGYSNKNNNNDN